MFAIIHNTPNGWTDAVGHGAPADANRWPTIEEARQAAAELLAVQAIGADWRVVPAADLPVFDLVA
jgi:hypothetical protein